MLYGLAKASAEHVGGLFFDGRVPAASGLTIGAHNMAGSIWHVRRSNGEQLRNQTTSDLQALARSGRLDPDDLVWREGLADWVKARKLKGLFSEQATPNPHVAISGSTSSPPPSPSANPDSKSNSSSLVLVNLLAGFAIICPASAILMAITKIHFVLGAFAGLCVLALVGAAAFALLFKSERIPAGIRGAAKWSVGLLIGIGLAGLFGLMTAIATPGVAKRHAEDTARRTELIEQAEAAYADGRVEDALALAEDAVLVGGALDDPTRTDARRLTDRLRRELESEQATVAAADQLTPGFQVEVETNWRSNLFGDHTGPITRVFEAEFRKSVQPLSQTTPMILKVSVECLLHQGIERYQEIGYEVRVFESPEQASGNPIAVFSSEKSGIFNPSASRTTFYGPDDTNYLGLVAGSCGDLNLFTQGRQLWVEVDEYRAGKLVQQNLWMGWIDVTYGWTETTR